MSVGGKSQQKGSSVFDSMDRSKQIRLTTLSTSKPAPSSAPRSKKVRFCLVQPCSADNVQHLFYNVQCQNAGYSNEVAMKNDKILLLPGHWYSTLQPHNAGAPSATLATGTPARRLQGGHVRPSVTVWHFADVLSRRLPSCCQCS